MSTSDWLGNISRTLKTNSPTILSGISVAGVVGTAVLAVKATNQAQVAIRGKKDDITYGDEVTSKNPPPDGEQFHALTAQEIFECCWRLYIPAALSGAATIACIIGANSIGIRRNAALAGAYTLVDQSFRDYKDKVLKQITAQKADKIEDEVAKERLHRTPVSDNQVFVTSRGDTLCMDSITGRYFRSDIEDIRKAENTINREIIQNLYASQNDFYELIGLESTTIGEELGWTIDNMLELHFSPLLNEADQPCLVIGYRRLPKRNYHKAQN